MPVFQNVQRLSDLPTWRALNLPSGHRGLLSLHWPVVSPRGEIEKPRANKRKLQRVSLSLPLHRQIWPQRKYSCQRRLVDTSHQPVVQAMLLLLVAAVMQQHPLLLERKVLAHSLLQNGALVVCVMGRAVMAHQLTGLPPGSWMVCGVLRVGIRVLLTVGDLCPRRERRGRRVRPTKSLDLQSMCLCI